MKFQHLLALSIGLTIAIAPSISLAKPAATTIAVNADRLPVPKLKADSQPERKLKNILKDEATWLNSKQYKERHEKLGQFKRELIVEALEIHNKSGGSNVTVPSSDTILYFADVFHESPQSGLLASLYAESRAANLLDAANIEQIYDQLITKHPTHPILLLSYRNVMLQKYNNNLPDLLRTKLTNLYDQAIAQDPQNSFLYIDRASITPKAPATILPQWKAAVAKFSNDPTVAWGFANLMLESEDSESPNYPKTVATSIQQVEAEIKQNPQSGPLYELYGYLHNKAKTPQKALPILQAGLAKGAEAARLNYLIGDAYLLSGEVDLAIAHYQKVVQAKTALCWGNMTERFEGLKTPKQQQAMLNLMLQSLSLKGGEECTSSLAAIGFNPEMNQRFGKEMIAAITPIAQSSKNIELRRVLLGLMSRQKQYTEITKIGPKLLPTNGSELDSGDYMYAEYMPLYIAEAHENLGNLDQATTFYNLLTEYSKGFYRKEAHPLTVQMTNWHLGRLAWKGGQSDQAVRLLQSVAVVQKVDWSFPMPDGKEVTYRALAHNLLGEIYQSQGKKADAKQQFEAAVKADANFKTPKDNLAKLGWR